MFYRISRKQYLINFFRMWCPKWKRFPSFRLTFHNAKNYRMEFFDGREDFDSRDPKTVWEMGSIKTSGLTLINDDLDQYLQNFALEIQAWRKSKGLSQTAVAKMLKMDRSNFSGIEKGKRKISQKMQRKIVSIIGENFS